MGEAYLMLGRDEEAEDALERYVQLAPQDPNAFDSLGTCKASVGRYDEAIESYNRALSINPESGVAIIHLGNAYFHQGQYRAALEQYRRFAKVAKNDGARARASECIAKIYLQKGDLSRATDAAKQTVKLNKENNLIALFCAWARGDQAASEKLKREALTAQSFPKLKHVGFLRFYYKLRGDIALQEGKTNEALDLYQETLRHRPLNWYIESFEDCLANANLQVGHYDAAIDEYQRILRLNPNFPLAYFHLAQAFQRKGETETAREYYDKFLQIWSHADNDIPQVILAKEQLKSLP
jgi:tetratricopeptide (TPR) repeat protein